MVILSHTVAHPRTMMVHTKNALIANLAVVYSRALDQITALAIRYFCHFADLFGAKYKETYSALILARVLRYFFLFRCITAFSLNS